MKTRIVAVLFAAMFILGVSAAPAYALLEPDLLMTAFTVTPLGDAGATVTISDTVMNDELLGVAGAFDVKYYLSTDSAITTSDTLLGSRSLPLGLPSVTSSSASTDVTIPADTPSGLYYIGAIADADAVIVETDETNNTAWDFSSITGMPDLTVSGLTAPASVDAGDAISVGTTIASSNGPADASTAKVYLSDDATITAGDTLLGSRAVGAIAEGGSSAGSTDVTISASVPTGSYYVGAIADADAAVTEIDESNNTSATAIGVTGMPDLTVPILSAPATASAGATITVEATVESSGGPSGASTAKLYLSADADITPADTLLGSGSVGAIAEGGTGGATVDVKLSTGLSTGSYYVGAIADANEVVTETNESNNTSATAIGVTGMPDLTPSAPSAPATALAGETITVETTITSAGGPSGASTARIYLSDDATITAGDTLLGSRAIGAIAEGDSSAASADVVLPLSVPTGAYYIGVVADADGAVTETDESNNASATVGTAAVTGGSDLVIDALSGPSSAVEGNSVSVSNTVANDGGMPAGTSVVKFYLSADATITPGVDTYLGERTVAALAAAGTDAASTSIPLPDGVTGSFRLGAYVDVDAAVSELVESNNSSSVAIDVTAAPVKTDVTSLTKPWARSTRYPYTVQGSTLKKYRTYKWTGFLNPRHSIGGHAVYISVKKYVSGQGFVHLRRYTATNYKHLSITQYSVNFPLGPGRYKLIPVSPEDTYHNRKVGTESYYTVK